MAFCCAAVDLGATSGRVILGVFNDTGLEAWEVHRFPNVPLTTAGLRCWDVESLFEQTLVGLAHAVERAAAMGHPLRSIAVDTWGVDYGLVDEDAQLLAPVRHYRAADDQSRDAALAEVSAQEFYSRAGIAPLAINTCFQLYRDARSGLLTPDMTMLLIPDLWTAWLTGVVGAERTIASTTGLVDWATGAWCDELLERWGIPRRILPDLADAGSLAGVTTPEVTRRIGSADPVPVVRTAAHDTASAFAAAASADDGRAVVSCGTWALVGCVSSDPVLTADALTAGLSNEATADGSAMIVRNLSGTWLLDECVAAWARADGTDDIDGLRARLIASADTCEPVSGTIDCGASELVSTADMPRALMALHAREHGTLAPGHAVGREQVVRLVLDSLAASFARTIDDVSSLTGRPARQVVMIGGGSRLPSLRRLTEQSTGLPVRIGPQEATSIGSMCIQAHAAGVFPTLEAARIAAGDAEVLHG